MSDTWGQIMMNITIDKTKKLPILIQFSQDGENLMWLNISHQKCRELGERLIDTAREAKGD